MWYLAIDFGTTASTGASCADGRVEALRIGGQDRIPSAVLLDEDGLLVAGQAAVNQAAMFPDRVDRTPKESLGGIAPLLLGGEAVHVPTAVAEVLRLLLDEGTRMHGGEPPVGAVITHPARWADNRKQSLREAATTAGIGQVELCPEPVGAAVHYAQGKVEPGAHVAVYDFGGGTFDTAVLRRTDDGFEWIGDAGLDDIGGEDLDFKLYELVGEHLEADDPELWESLTASDELRWRRANLRLQEEVRKAKEALSLYPTTRVPVPNSDRDVLLTREEFESLVGDDIDSTIDSFHQTILDAGLTPDDISVIFLAGGSSRIPLVERRMTERYGRKVTTSDDPKLVVVRGAALWLAGSAARVGGPLGAIGASGAPGSGPELDAGPVPEVAAAQSWGPPPAAPGVPPWQTAQGVAPADAAAVAAAGLDVTHAPGTQVPGTQVPGTQVPGTQVPGTDGFGPPDQGWTGAGSQGSAIPGPGSWGPQQWPGPDPNPNAGAQPGAWGPPQGAPQDPQQSWSDGSGHGSPHDGLPSASAPTWPAPTWPAPTAGAAHGPTPQPGHGGFATPPPPAGAGPAAVAGPIPPDAHTAQVNPHPASQAGQPASNQGHGYGGPTFPLAAGESILLFQQVGGSMSGVLSLTTARLVLQDFSGGVTFDLPLGEVAYVTTGGFSNLQVATRSGATQNFRIGARGVFRWVKSTNEAVARATTPGFPGSGAVPGQGPQQFPAPHAPTTPPAPAPHAPTTPPAPAPHAPTTPPAPAPHAPTTPPGATARADEGGEAPADPDRPQHVVMVGGLEDPPRPAAVEPPSPDTPGGQSGWPVPPNQGGA